MAYGRFMQQSHGGAWANGDPVMFEASTAEGFEPVLFEVDGEELSNAV